MCLAVCLLGRDIVNPIAYQTKSVPRESVMMQKKDRQAFSLWPGMVEVTFWFACPCWVISLLGWTRGIVAKCCPVMQDFSCHAGLAVACNAYQYKRNTPGDDLLKYKWRKKLFGWTPIRQVWAPKQLFCRSVGGKTAADGPDPKKRGAVRVDRHTLVWDLLNLSFSIR